MGFYLKKGINFGPLRLNVSKSGLGMSFGAKGLRLGYGTIFMPVVRVCITEKI